MPINTKSRTELKAYFVKNAIPTESNFADLIDAMVNQKDDGIDKPAGNPLEIYATGDANSVKKVLNIYENSNDPDPKWGISLNPRTNQNDPSTGHAGWAIQDANGVGRLFIEKATGRVSVGNIQPAGQVDIQAANRSGTHPTNRILYVTGNSSEADGIEFRHSNGSQGIGFGYNTIYATGTNVDQDLRLKARGNGAVVVVGSALTPTAGKSANAGIMFPTDPGGGSSDAAWMRYYPRTGEACTLEIGISNDGDDHITLMPSGNVGINVAVPQAILHVEGNTEVHSGGPVGGYSFANRNAPNNGARSDVAAGVRWVWYSTDQVARLWCNRMGDRISVNSLGQFAAAGGKGGYVMDQFVNTLDDTLEEGDVVVIGSNQVSIYYGHNDGIPIPEVDLTTKTMDTRVCGIVCSVHGYVEQNEDAPSGMRTRALTTEELDASDYTKVQKGQSGWMVTLGTYAYCKVDADIAPIEVGDLLATSPTRGHAQKVDRDSRSAGSILGKALGSLRSGKGKIPVLVTLQ